MGRTVRGTPSRTRLVTLFSAVLLPLLVLVLVACGGEGGAGGASSPTRTPTVDRTIDRPTDRPTDDRPDPGESDGPTPDEPTPDEPTPDRPEPTRDRSQQPGDGSGEELPATPTPEPTAQAEANVSAETGNDVVEADEPVPSWVWWALGAVLLAIAVSVPLFVRSRRRASWRRDLAEVEGELAWFARELLPELRHARSREEVAGGWKVAQPRVVAAEDRLTVLGSSAADQAGRDRARELLVASRRARTGMQALTSAGPEETWALDLDSIMDDLEHTLTGHGPTPSTPSA